MIRFQCPNCNTVLQIGSEYAGQPVLCSSCNTQLIVPQMPVREPTLDKADRSVIICICGQCKSTFKLPAASAGRQVPCPKCGHSAQIPEEEKVITGSNTLKFACPACWQYYCVMAKYAGKKFKCLICKQPCMIPRPASPPQDLVLLEEDKSPSPPPVPQAGQELSFKLLAEEEPQPSPYQLELEQNAPPQPPPIPRESPPPPAARTPKSGDKAPGSHLKLVAGILAGIIGFVAGFAVVYMLVKPKSPGVQPEQVQTTEQAEAEEQAPFVKQTPTQVQSRPAEKPALRAPAEQNPEAIEFARSLVTRINQKSEDLNELIYQFPDEVNVTEEMIQSVIAALDIGALQSIDSTVEAARKDFVASFYIVKSDIASEDVQKREVRIGFFEIIETDEEKRKAETVHWIYGITVLDETGKILASVGRTNPDQLAAQMDAKVDEYAVGFSEEEEEATEQAEEISTELESAIETFAYPILIAFFIIALIMVVSMWTVYVKAGEPGWAVLIPVYNLVVLARIGGRPEWMGLACFLSPLIPFIGGLINLYLMVYITIGVAETFGKGILFALGLFFLPFIFYPILALTGDTFTD
jgi:hypothetical protein